MFAIIPGWSIGELAILVVIVCAVIGIVFVAVKAFGLSIPGWVIQIFWIVVVCFVAIAAIRLVMSM